MVGKIIKRLTREVYSSKLSSIDREIGVAETISGTNPEPDERIIFLPAPIRKFYERYGESWRENCASLNSQKKKYR